MCTAPGFPLETRPLPAIANGDGVVKFTDTGEAAGDTSGARANTAALSTPAALLLLLRLVGGSALT